MTQPEKKNLPASVYQRLLNKARTDGRPFNEVLQYYAIERFLYRLAQSPYRDKFILKGALIFMTWGAPFSRPTRDIDLLAKVSNEIAEIVKIFKAICTQGVADDGMVYEGRSLMGEMIKEHDEYQGIRIKFLGRLSTSRAAMQIDLGFADVVTPRAKLVDYPVLLDWPAPRLRGYPPETVVAEKLHAVVALGMSNSRMKDFFDLWLLATSFQLEPELVQTAVEKTFARRRTPLPRQIPVALTEQFAKEKQAQWQAFLKRSKITGAPTALIEVLIVLRTKFEPMLGLK